MARAKSTTPKPKPKPRPVKIPKEVKESAASVKKRQEVVRIKELEIEVKELRQLCEVYIMSMQKMCSENKFLLMLIWKYENTSAAGVQAQSPVGSQDSTVSEEEISNQVDQLRQIHKHLDTENTNDFDTAFLEYLDWMDEVQQRNLQGLMHIYFQSQTNPKLSHITPDVEWRKRKVEGGSYQSPYFMDSTAIPAQIVRIPRKAVAHVPDHVSPAAYKSQGYLHDLV